MADKDLLAIIADTLRRLDQQGERLELHGKVLEKQGEAIERQGEAIERQGEAIERQGEAILLINDTLKSFMDVSIKHFEHQEDFNQQFLASNKEVVKRLNSIETTLNRT